MEKEKIVSKIEKLLGLAGNNPNAHEAESALLKAQELMLVHKIEEAELKQNDPSAIDIGEAICRESSNTAWARSLVHLFAENFGCVVYMKRTSKKQRFSVFFGNREDAEIARNLYDYTIVWLNKAACKYATNKRNNEGIVKGVKQDYIIGFLKGLEDKYKEQIASNEQYALLVVVPEKVQTEYDIMTANMKKANYSRTIRVHGSLEAQADGYDAGKSFQTNALKGGA